MTTEELIIYYAALSQQMLKDPVLSLAITTSVFDPLGVYYEHDLLENAEEPHPALVLMVARQAFPDFYTAACAMLLAGTDFDTVASHTAELISDAMGGLETYGWEGFYWGIPMPAYGVDWEQPETDTHYTRLLAVFDRTSASDLDNLDCYAARLVIDSLPSHPTWQHVAHLLGHFFSLTGNSCVDCTWETLAELQPLFWQPEDIELARTIIGEANDLLSSAGRGLAALESHTIFHTLHSTIRWLRQKLETITRHHLENDYELSRYLSRHPIDIEWPDPV